MDNIMDQISKKAVETYNIAAKATEKFSKEIKIKSKMSENKIKIQEFYEDIGKTLYEKYVLKEEINLDRDLINNCSMIDILAEENEDLRMELLKLKNLKQCPKCHYEIYSDFYFCPNCGSEQEEPKENKEKQNDGPAKIVTTDLEDVKLRKHIDSFSTDNEDYNSEDSEIDNINKNE